MSSERRLYKSTVRETNPLNLVAITDGARAIVRGCLRLWSQSHCDFGLVPFVQEATAIDVNDLLDKVENSLT